MAAMKYDHYNNDFDVFSVLFFFYIFPYRSKKNKKK